MARKLTQDEYVKRAADFGVKVLGEYQGRQVKIKHECVCGAEWITRPDNVLTGRRCTKCKYSEMSRKFVKPLNVYLAELESIGVKLIGDYVNTNVKTSHECVCGRQFHAKPMRILQGDLCGICRKNKDKLITHNDYLARLSERNIEVSPIEPYVNMRTKINHKCTCGDVWLVSPLNVLNGGMCGCTRSLGELEIRSYLNEKGFKFQQEYSYKELVSSKNRRLRFDFAVIEGEQVIYLIEYHGKQHFEFNEKWHVDEQGFLESKERDLKKQNFAKNKGIPLIVIRYDDDVFTSLEKGLKKYAKIS